MNSEQEYSEREIAQNEERKKLEIRRHLCETSMLFFTRYFFRVRQGIPMLVNWHHHFIAEELDKVISGETENLLINVSPGSTKTEMAVISFMARGLALNPHAKFLHLSSGDDLVLLNSQTAREIVTSEEFQKMWPRKISSDDSAKKRWNVMVNENNKVQKGGGVYAVALGGQITGFRAGRMTEGFQGAIVCFPYEQTVLTEFGPIPIGKIVDEKLNIRAYTRNMQSGAIELQPIDNWNKNPASNIIQITLSDGQKIKCTPDHKIWTDNRGWVEAMYLSADDSITDFISFKSLPYRLPIKSRHLAHFRNVLGFVKNIIPLRWTSSVPVVKATPINVGGFCNVFSDFPIFDKAYQRNRNSKFSRYFIKASACLANLKNLLIGYFGPRAFFAKQILTKAMAILHILLSSPIRKVLKSIVRLYTVFMKHLHIRSLWTNKCLHDCLMDVNSVFDTIHSRNKLQIVSGIAGKLKHYALSFSSFSCGSIVNGSIDATHSSHIRNFIKPMIVKKRKPILIEYVGHADATYCLTMRDNHNFFVGNRQRALLVSNCDDPLKADDAFSDAKVKVANRRLITTVKSRKANPKTPMVVIMQRVGDKDPSAFIKAGNLPGKWRCVSIPALINEAYLATLPEHIAALARESTKDAPRDDKGRFSYWEYKEPLQELLDMEAGIGQDKEGNRVSRFVFASQYQQEPTVLGGDIIHDRFPRVAVLPKMKHRVIYGDTAQKTAEANDYSVFQCWGFGEDGKLYLIDQIRGKWEAPDLKKRAREFWAKHSDAAFYNPALFGKAREIKIEDKASGTGLIQDLKRGEVIEGRPYPPLPVKPIERTKDKLTRVMDVVSYIDAGLVCLYDGQPWVNDFIAECEAFTADNTHAHDDQIDPMCDAISDLLGPKKKSFFY